jgi:hypothetical protein
MNKLISGLTALLTKTISVQQDSTPDLVESLDESVLDESVNVNRVNARRRLGQSISRMHVRKGRVVMRRGRPAYMSIKTASQKRTASVKFRSSPARRAALRKATIARKLNEIKSIEIERLMPEELNDLVIYGADVIPYNHSRL